MGSVTGQVAGLNLQMQVSVLRIEARRYGNATGASISVHAVNGSLATLPFERVESSSMPAVTAHAENGRPPCIGGGPRVGPGSRPPGTTCSAVRPDRQTLSALDGSIRARSRFVPPWRRVLGRLQPDAVDQLSNSAASSASSESGPASIPALCRRVRGSRRWK